MKFGTKVIHAGVEPDPTSGAVMTPIYQTSTYVQEEIGKHKGYEYSRTGNPTRKALEECLASLEEARFGLAFASGLAAEQNVMHLLSSGDHVVVGDDVYGGTYRFFDKVMTRYGVTFTFVDATNLSNVEEAIKDKTGNMLQRLPFTRVPSSASVQEDKVSLLEEDNSGDEMEVGQLNDFKHWQRQMSPQTDYNMEARFHSMLNSVEEVLY